MMSVLGQLNGYFEELINKQAIFGLFNNINLMEKYKGRSMEEIF